MHEIDVVGIGNAIVDVLCQADDAFLERHDLTKGAMMLVDAEQASRLYAAMPPGVEVSGGSAANTMAGIAALGGKGAFIGKVRDDQLGEVFAHDIRSIGLSFMTPPLLEGAPTGRCLIVVTPDAQRTMNTFLGAAIDLTAEDINPEVIRAAKITYLEGYLWDPEAAKAAFRKALDVAHAGGRKVALTLSDSFCVDRHRDEFRALVDQVDIVFANEAEILSLYQVATFDEALHAVRKAGTLAVLTRSEQGSVILDGDDVHVIGAERGVNVLDTTGAGDLYAAGFLAGLTSGKPLAQCGRMGAIAAAEAISHMGARPQVDLAALVAEKLG
ncbi:adenosine kinase [Emcibacter sp. SYSU 3D8]|uniref:adenosine kinase n=1 Tax=Emcibacter sp. SYSU 3D8 TaxID=3133969 RepID=UPI0031FEA7DC